MLINCQYVAGICTQCKQPGNSVRVCRPGRIRAVHYTTPCPHLGEPTGKSALLKCDSCGGNVRKKFPIHHCELFELCLPQVPQSAVKTAERADGCHGCVGCQREANPDGCYSGGQPKTFFTNAPTITPQTA